MNQSEQKKTQIAESNRSQEQVIEEFVASSKANPTSSINKNNHRLTDANKRYIKIWNELWYNK